jgi:hypothetical protein
MPWTLIDFGRRSDTRPERPPAPIVVELRRRADERESPMSEIIHRIAARAGVTPDQCRTVLEAMREPEPEMIDAGIDAALRCWKRDDVEACVWRAMIACALDPDCRVWDEPEPDPAPDRQGG